MSEDNRITIKDIAKETGLSIATVSRILSGKGQHNGDTVKRVLNVAEQLGYVKNTAAVDLVKRQSHVIAVIVSNTKSNFSSSIITAIENQAAANDLDVFILYAGNNDSSSQSRAIRTVIERAVKGIILVSLELNEHVKSILADTTIPSIFLSTAVKDQSFPYVTSDNYQMGYKATEFLIKKGHRSIGLIGIPQHGSISDRIRGYEQCLHDYQIPFNDKHIQIGDCLYEDGSNALTKFENKLPITAAICASDIVAIGMMNSVKDAGYKVPDDLSLISFDGTELVDYVRPAITSVTQSFYNMGIEGVNYLLNDATIKMKYLPFKIIERQSTQKLI